MNFRHLRRLVKAKGGYAYDELAMPNFEIRIAHLQPGRLKDKLCVKFETILLNVSRIVGLILEALAEHVLVADSARMSLWSMKHCHIRGALKRTHPSYM
jgi:hypothetical protein